MECALVAPPGDSLLTMPPQSYVFLADRNLPIQLPNGQTLLIAYTSGVIGLYWFNDGIKTEPVKTITLDPEQWPGIFVSSRGWNLMLVMELVLTVAWSDNAP